MTEVGQCRRCSKMIGVRTDGYLRVHGPRGKRCAGSGTAPSGAPSDGEPYSKSNNE